MSLLTGVGDFFGLDIGTSAVRLVQLHGTGPIKSLVKFAEVPISDQLVLSDAKADHQKLAQVIHDMLSKAQIATKNVAVNIPSQKVFTAVVDLDHLAPAELSKSIRFQADSLIPTPLAESKIDWALLGDSPKDKTKVEVLLTSVSNSFVEARLDMLESIGLNIIAFEPDNLAIVRALVPGENTGTQMIVDIGALNTDMVIALNGAPRLTRSIPSGTRAFVNAAVQNLNIEAAQAEQFVFKFGLGKDKLEGQIYQAIIGTVDILISEVDKSIKFFTTRYPEAKIDRIIVTGGASTLPEFPNYLANKSGLSVEIGNSWRNVAFSADRQNELLSVSNHFAVAAGLAERKE